MGKCLKCGKETKHYYECYTAKLIDSSSQTMHMGDTVITEKKHSFDNFTKQEGYLCSRHQGMTIFMSIGIALAMFALAIIAIISRGYGWIIGLIFFGVFGIIMLIVIFITIRNMNADKPISRKQEEIDSYFMSFITKQLSGKKNVAFTIEQYENLVKQNQNKLCL